MIGSIVISIHSLVRGRTPHECFDVYEDGISIHSLVRGRTPMTLTLSNGRLISIHSLVRGRTLLFFLRLILP